jgi:uncharacterized membrane protein SirB2
MNYATLKLFHITTVAASLGLFALRGAMMLMGANTPRLLRWLPHLIDTCLLASGIALAVVAHFNPLQQPWLALKLLRVLLYIILGSVALKRGKTKNLRLAALLAALAVAVFIVKLAWSKQPGW